MLFMATKNSFFAIATDIGGRDENQDRAYALSLNGRTLLVLADGMGGHRGGAMASQAIIETAERLFRANPAQNPEALLPQIVRESCGVIARENSAQNLDGHSTCVLAFIDEKACLSWLRIGDSRLFIFADKDHWWRSIDHTMLDLRVLKGELTDDEARRHPDRPFVFRSVCATEPEMKVQRFGTLPAGAVLFLCSDGVWDAFPAKELYNVTKKGNLEAITVKIVKTAVARNGAHSDNCTALLYRAPFGNAKVNTRQLHLEELHTLPQITESEKIFRKKVLIGVMSVLFVIILVTTWYLMLPSRTSESMPQPPITVEDMNKQQNGSEEEPIESGEESEKHGKPDGTECQQGTEGKKKNISKKDKILTEKKSDDTNKTENKVTKESKSTNDKTDSKVDKDSDNRREDEQHKSKEPTKQKKLNDEKEHEKQSIEPKESNAQKNVESEK